MESSQRVMLDLKKMLTLELNNLKFERIDSVVTAFVLQYERRYLQLSEELRRFFLEYGQLLIATVWEDRRSLSICTTNHRQRLEVYLKAYANDMVFA